MKISVAHLGAHYLLEADFVAEGGTTKGLIVDNSPAVVTGVRCSCARSEYSVHLDGSLG